MEYYCKMATIPALIVFILSILIADVHTEEKFMEQPKNATVSEGQAHTIRCSIADRQGVAQWVRNGFGLGPGPQYEGFPRYKVLENHATGEYHLQISDVQLEDDATFECQVGATQHSAGLKSRQAFISVQLPADSVSIQQGTHTDVIAGESNTLTCRARNGRPAPAIIWYSPSNADFLTKRQHNITQFVTVQSDGKREDVESRLTFVPKKEDQGLEVVCSAKNGAMSTPKIAPVNLNVLTKPDIRMDGPEVSVVAEGSSLVLTCSAISNPKVLHWRWLRDGVEMADEVKESMRIPRIRGSMDGSIVECEASNSVGSATKSRRIVVHYGPQFNAEPQFPAASRGDDVTLTCEVSSNPPAVIRWTRPGSSRIIGSGKSLAVKNVREDDFRSGFTCSAIGGTGAEVHRHVRILEKGPPKIVGSKEQGASYGSLGKVECIVEGVPKPNKISWSKDGQELDISTANRYRIREEDLTYGVRSVLEIQSVQPRDFTAYNCTAVSDLGSDSMTIKFSKREVIPIAYIIPGVIVGLLIIVAIILAVVFYRRRRSILSNSGSSTTSSEDSIKKLGQPNLKIEFSTDTVDSWQQKNLLDSSYPHHSTSEYDELRHPGYRDTHTLGYPSRNGYAGSVDGNGTYGQHRDPYYRPVSRQTLDNPYGTLPRGPASVSSRLNGHPEASRLNGGGYYETATGADIYGTYGGRRPRYGYPQSDMGVLPPPSFDRLPPPPLSPTESKLSTNV